MATIKLEVGGTPIEIDLGDGCELSFADGKLTIRTKAQLPVYIYQQYPSLVNPIPPMYPAYPHYPLEYPPPTITWGTGSIPGITGLTATN